MVLWISWKRFLMIYFVTKIVFSWTNFVHIKMSCHWLNRQGLLEKAKDRYHNSSGKEKASEYYILRMKMF